ncbi:uncharacterized protein LOC142173530 [Nicotiana tabacum]|uniref:Uncharacterized protein LOC142173530 n=1 Tax=Nicotiana tabacum TaxID=4097 RepID=A0AC58TDF6_TOBAC
MGSLAHIAPAKRLSVKDIQRLEDTGIRFSVRNSEALLACAQAKSSLVEHIKATQYKDERLCKYRDEALAGKSKDMIVESDGVLQMGDMLCIADVDGLRHAILEEAHNSKYTIHPGSTKLYHDLKQFYWWEGMNKDVSNFVSSCLTCQQVKAEINDLQDCYNKLRFQNGNGKELLWIFSPGYHKPLEVMTLYG